MTSAFVDIAAVARHFSVSISTIRAWIRQGHISPDSYIRVGNTYRFKLDEVERGLTGAKEKEVKLKEELVTAKTPEQLELNFDADEDI
jgi:excisionase family DNA binding protein